MACPEAYRWPGFSELHPYRRACEQLMEGLSLHGYAIDETRVFAAGWEKGLIKGLLVVSFLWCPIDVGYRLVLTIRRRGVEREEALGLFESLALLHGPEFYLDHAGPWPELRCGPETEVEHILANLPLIERLVETREPTELNEQAEAVFHEVNRGRARRRGILSPHRWRAFVRRWRARVRRILRREPAVRRIERFTRGPEAESWLLCWVEGQERKALTVELDPCHTLLCDGRCYLRVLAYSPDCRTWCKGYRAPEADWVFVPSARWGGRKDSSATRIEQERHRFFIWLALASGNLRWEISRFFSREPPAGGRPPGDAIPVADLARALGQSAPTGLCAQAEWILAQRRPIAEFLHD